MLGGIRIVEIGQGLAVPVAGLMLAESGAEVSKDRTVCAATLGAARAAFATWNRSKRSAELDLDDPADCLRLHALLAEADVLIHDMAPSRAKQLGLDDPSLAISVPRLIVCSVTGYPVGHRRRRATC